MSETGKSKRKLKGLLIHPGFQLSFVGLYIFINIAALFVIYFGVRMSLMQTLNEIQAVGVDAQSPIYLALVTHSETVLTVVLLLSLIALVGLFVGGIYLSHKVAGPLYRLRISIEAMEAEGKLKPIKFRDGDYFQEIPILFNRMIDKVIAPKAP